MNKQRRNSGQTTVATGVLETHSKGFGFLRDPMRSLARCERAPFVSESLIKRFDLKSGSLIQGHVGIRNRHKQGPRLTRIQQINGIEVEEYCVPTPFDDLVATNPNKWLRLEGDIHSPSMRVIDLLCPLGLGQRALIAATPRAGKTTLLAQIAASLATNYPDLVIKTLLIDERPEEVTDVREMALGDVFASNLDETPENHARLSRLAIDHCQRLTESGQDVVLIVDSLTRMSRAFNKLPCASRVTGAGGLNIRALDFPKKLFGSARRCAQGGSLTIIASVLIDTDNRMDEVIFREFKGTGNWDLVLDSKLADQRIWPAINVQQSATRRTELLQDPTTLNAVTALRRSMMAMPNDQAMRELIDKLQRFPTNGHFIKMINESLQVA